MKVTTFPVAVLLIHVLDVVTFEDRADKFEMFALVKATEVALRVAIFDIL